MDQPSINADQTETKVVTLSRRHCKRWTVEEVIKGVATEVSKLRKGGEGEGRDTYGARFQSSMLGGTLEEDLRSTRRY